LIGKALVGPVLIAGQLPFPVDTKIPIFPI